MTSPGPHPTRCRSPGRSTRVLALLTFLSLVLSLAPGYLGGMASLLLALVALLALREQQRLEAAVPSRKDPAP